MLMDSRFEFSTLQALTDSAASENYIDLGVAGDADDELYLIVRVGTALVSSGKSATLVVGIQTDAASTFNTGPTTLAASGSIAEASCTANTEVFVIRLPRGIERYLRLYYTVGTEDFTSGTVDAFVTKRPQTADFQTA